MTLEQFIDSLHINTIDALELKSRIKVLVEEERNKAIECIITSVDEICDAERDRCYDFSSCSDCYKAGIKDIAEQMKAGE